MGEVVVDLTLLISVEEYLQDWRFWNPLVDKEVRLVSPVPEHDFVLSLIDEGMQIGKNNLNVHSLFNYDQGIVDIKIQVQRITRIEHPTLLACFEASMEKMIYENSKRAVSGFVAVL